MTSQKTRQLTREWLIKIGLVVAVLAVIAGNFWRAQMMQSLQSITGDPLNIPVALEAYILGMEGDQKIFSPKLKRRGQTLIFRATPHRPGFFALLQFHRDGSIEVVAEKQAMEAGAEQLIQAKESTFTYELLGSIEIERFCLLGFSDDEKLMETLEQIKQGLSYAVEGSCIAI